MVTTRNPPTRIRPASLPEDVVVAVFELGLNIVEEERARHQAELLLAEVRGFFHARHLALALLYDLDFEITETHQGTWKFRGVFRLNLKPKWKALKKRHKAAFLVVAGLAGGVSAYPDLREGFIDLSHDVKSAYTYVVGSRSETNPQLITSFECRRPKSGEFSEREKTSGLDKHLRKAGGSKPKR